MTGVEDREPLWATGLADQPKREDDFVAQPVVAPPPPAERVRLDGLLLAFMVLLAAALALAAALSIGSGTLVEVRSSWEGIPMRCDTARIERGGRAIERFDCRATGGRSLPPGVYRTPDARWTSDLTRADALANELVITGDGELTGWAIYRQ